LSCFQTDAPVDPALERDCADLLPVHHRQAGDVGDALELGRALRSRDVRLPAEGPGVDVEREQLAAGGAGKQRAAGERAADEAAHGQRRIQPLVDPFLAAVGLAEGEDFSVDRPDQDLALGRLRRPGDFTRDLGLP